MSAQPIPKSMKLLRVKARRKAEKLGHRLGSWFSRGHTPRMDKEVHAQCRKHGCCAMVTIQDWDIELYKEDRERGLTPRPRIFGTAVGLRCEGLSKAPVNVRLPILPNDDVAAVGIVALRKVLRGLRWDDQNGYHSYLGDGKWAFVTTSLPQTSPKDLNALFALAQIEPDVVKSYGECKDCRYSDKNGNERGYSPPCAGCMRPAMLNFEPRRKA